MTAIKLTRNEILDLAVTSFIQMLYAEALRYQELMKAKQNEIYQVQQQIKDYKGNTSKFDDLIEDLNTTCARICRSHGMVPGEFEIRAHVQGTTTKILVNMKESPRKEVKTRKAPARLVAKEEQLQAEVREAQSKGIETRDKMRELEKNQKHARQTILQKLAQDQGISAQINELVGILVEAEINPPSPPATI